MKLLSKNLFYLRKMKGWQQSEMYDRIGIRATTWSMYENDKSQPTLETLMMISNFFEVSETDLLRKDLSNANLILKSGEEKNQENANLNANPNANLSIKKEAFKERKYEFQTGFNQALNEDEAPLTLHQRMERLLAIVAENESKTAKRISQIEDKLSALAKRVSKK